MTSTSEPERAPDPPRRRRTRAVLVALGWMLLGGLLTAGGITWWALDRFVVDHVDVEDVNIFEQNRTTDTTPLVTFPPTADSFEPRATDSPSQTSAPDSVDRPRTSEMP